MIEVNSFINTVGDYAYDCELRHDMLLRDTKFTGDIVVINTEMCSIVVTDNTMLMDDRGLWKYASDLQVGNALKSYVTNRVVVTGVTSYHVNDKPMYRLVDCDKGFIVANGFHVSVDK
mgnify:CR=1 FL=1